ncbi:MAG: MogA/MoaB family molybdenum cofactor biosynthesis protein [Acidobacteria bacterium]|nr:MogA/MoaB family molybdenum cofactor biosynthesis protein [Acidobacteriota bacterium]
MARSYRAAIVTVSDSVAGGTREDLSGPAIIRILQSAGWTIKSTETLPDDFSLLRERLGALAVDVEADAVFTTGGTGIGPRDRTPEATTSVMERSVPGLAELMRRQGVKKTPLAALSRAVVGVKGKALLINLPGSPAGAEDSLRAILELLPHAIDVIRGEETHDQAPAAGPPPAATPSPEATEQPAPAADAAPADAPSQGTSDSEPNVPE